MEVRFHPAEEAGSFVDLLLEVLVQASLPRMAEEALCAGSRAAAARAVETCAGETDT